MPEDFSGGEYTETETMQGRTWPCLRQFCVFLENRVGKLSDLMRQVESLDTRVLAMSIVQKMTSLSPFLEKRSAAPTSTASVGGGCSLSCCPLTPPRLRLNLNWVGSFAHSF
jgi:hypothetical protein